MEKSVKGNFKIGRLWQTCQSLLIFGDFYVIIGYYSYLRDLIHNV